MSEVQFTEDDLNDFLEQAKTIPSAEAVYVLEPEGEVVCHQGTCENVDTAYFTKYTDDSIGSDSLEFQGNSYAFIMEKESEPGSVENKMWLYMSKQKIQWGNKEPAKVGAVVMNHAAGLIVIVFCNENALRLILGEMQTYLIDQLQ